MLALAAAKKRTGEAPQNAVLTTEAGVTLIYGYLAGAILTGLTLNAAVGGGRRTPSRGWSSSSTDC
jgi:hypothetical protein